MILKVNNNVDELMFGIRSIRWFPNDDSEDHFVESMIFCFEANDVMFAYSEHELPFEEPYCAAIKFKDNSYLQLQIGGEDRMKNIEKLITEINKTKLLETKWADQNPEQYI